MSINNNKKIQDKKWDSLSTFFLAIFIAVLLNLVLARLTFKIDLTKERIFSLSAVSKTIVKQLREPLTIKVFFTEQLPAPYNNYERYMRDLLSEYQSSGGNLFRVEFVDLKKNPGAPSEYGIPAVQLEAVEKDQVQFKRAYMGVVFIHGDMVEKIQKVNSTEGLEYRITSLIKKMISKVDRIHELKEPFQAVLYASSNIPIEGIEMLNEAVKVRASAVKSRLLGKLEFQSFDPSIDKTEVETAKKLQIPSLSWGTFVNQNGVRVPGGTGYIGLSISYQGKHKVINLLGRDNTDNYVIAGIDELEVNMMGVVDNLLSINPRIGYLTGHGEPDIWGGGSDETGDVITRFATLVQQDYDFEPITVPNGPLPEGLSALLVVEPKFPMTDYELYEIDQFIMSGKPVAFFQAGLFYPMPDKQSMLSGALPRAVVNLSGTSKLLKSYGIQINPDLVLDKNCYKQDMQAESGGGQLPIYYAPIIEQDDVLKESIITKKIKGMLFLKASSIEPVHDRLKSTGAVFKPLIKTTKEAWTVSNDITLYPYYFKVPPVNQQGQYTIAGILEGGLKSYFEGKPIPRYDPEAVKQAVNAAQLHETFSTWNPKTDKAKIAVIGSSDVLKDSIVDDDGKGPNAVFARNLVDWLVGDTALIQIRNKGLSYNPPRKTSETVRNIVRAVNIACAPLLVVLAGLILWRFDTACRKKIQQSFKK